MNPHAITEEFERALCVYTGARFAVTVNSCTMALLLCCAWKRRHRPYEGVDVITIPSHTYVGVPMSILHAGFRVAFRDEKWRGEYMLDPLKIWDAARRFTGGMFDNYRGPHMQCVSFHVSKILGHSQGGAILHNIPEADMWFRRARFDGRTPGLEATADYFDQLGWHCYLSPDVAGALLWKLSVLPRHNDDLPNSNYPNLSRHPLFAEG